MSWLSRFTQAWRTSMAGGDQARAGHERARQDLAVTVGDNCQGVVVGDGTTQENSFVFGPAGEEPDEEPPGDWDPGDEVDDEGGMSEVNPMADEVAREEADYFWPELGQ